MHVAWANYPVFNTCFDSAGLPSSFPAKKQQLQQNSAKVLKDEEREGVFEKERFYSWEIEVCERLALVNKKGEEEKEKEQFE